MNRILQISICFLGICRLVDPSLAISQENRGVDRREETLREEPYATSSSSWHVLARQALERDAIYRLPVASDLRSAEVAFRQLAQRAPLTQQQRDEVTRHLERIHLSLVLTRDSQNRELRLVCETKSPKRGLGVYLIRPAGTVPVILQAPHGFFDSMTREICEAEFEHGDYFAAAWNTCHRSQVDLAHETRHVFHEFTKALISTAGSQHIVQLHGFGTQKRKNSRTVGADVIVSNGTEYPSRMTRHLSEELRLLWPQRDVRLFPWTVQELGATTNVQAACVAGSPEDSFTSLELSASLRQNWLKNQEHQGSFSQALAAVFRKPRETENLNDQVDFAD